MSTHEQLASIVDAISNTKMMPFRTALIYATFSAAWILVSDRALEYLVPPSNPNNVLLQTLKGWLFVIASASLVYFLLRSDVRALEQRRKYINYQAGLLDDVSDAIISLDSKFNVVSWNHAAERIYGWTAHEVIGHALNDFVKTEYMHGETSQEAIRSVAEKGSWHGEVTQHRKDGSALPL